MGFFDDIFRQPFGGMFDFNRDGRTDFAEEWLGHMIINECMKEDKEKSYSDSSFFIDDDTDFWQLDCEDGSEYGLDPYDYDSKYEYEEALEDAKTEVLSGENSWRDFCEDGFDYDVDPNDYDNEEDYMEALEEAKTASEEEIYQFESSEELPYQANITIPIKLSFSLERPGQDLLDAIKKENYLNKRQYDAAYYLCELQQDIGYVPYNSTKEFEIEKCNFILSAESIAAKYLTLRDGFLFVQAVKENFELPISVQDEDKEVLNDFEEFLMQLAEEDAKLAVDVWAWVVKEFSPYRQYMSLPQTIYNHILISTDDYPDKFLSFAIKKLGEDIKFCNELLTENPQFPFGISDYITQALASDCVKEAQIIFTAVAMNTKARVKDMENLINAVIMECSNWEELETMEKFKDNILPIIKKMNSKRIQRLYPDFKKTADEYINNVETSIEKYQYSRRFEWRNKYKDEPLYDIDPLDYDLEADYFDAVQKEKYAWRQYQYEARKYGIDVNDFETEADYLVVLNQKLEEKRKSLSEIKPKPQPTYDPLSETDKTIYNFCCVIFSSKSHPYSYLVGDLDIKIGDKVIVPVGEENTERIATVVSTSQHMRLTAPFPVDKAKKIIKKIEE